MPAKYSAFFFQWPCFEEKIDKISQFLIPNITPKN